MHSGARRWTTAARETLEGRKARSSNGVQREPRGCTSIVCMRDIIRNREVSTRGAESVQNLSYCVAR